MAKDNIEEPPDGLIKTTRHANDNIQEMRYHNPQDDDILITRTGKQPVLKVCTLYGALFEELAWALTIVKRNFGFMSILGFGTLVISTWLGAFVGGPAGLVYGFIFVWAGNVATFASLAELASL
ncbi:MAG: hypothetical protein Q9191_006131 [Dirinaria sp. TL-2023a]